ncbi:malate dehydrogenase-like [Schistocerca piceifrons]|uniref:malate dehydrogenase-like n=1 Tax=Schistocerca piceifrons TaxID=274613 RepID=UPI001F5F008C|nr:malate dehydrogenase-like [Schistocerca piceifrons]
MLEESDVDVNNPATFVHSDDEDAYVSTTHNDKLMMTMIVLVLVTETVRSSVVLLQILVSLQPLWNDNYYTSVPLTKQLFEKEGKFNVILRKSRRHLPAIMNNNIKEGEMVGAHLRLDTSCVDGAIIWGNSWGVHFLPDLYHATVTLPETLARLRERKQPARKVVADDVWLKKDLHQQMVKQQNLQRGSKPARFNLSQSTAIIKHIHDLWHGTEPDKAVSMAVFSDGSYDVPPGLMFTMPTVCKDRSWKIKQLFSESFEDVPNHLQMELTNLQCSTQVKHQFFAVPSTKEF